MKTSKNMKSNNKTSKKTTTKKEKRSPTNSAGTNTKKLETKIVISSVDELMMFSDEYDWDEELNAQDFPFMTFDDKTKQEVKSVLDSNETAKNEVKEEYKMFSLFETLFDHFDLLKGCSKTKSSSLRTIMIQLLSDRIKEPKSILGTMKLIEKEEQDVFSKIHIINLLSILRKIHIYCLKI
ncbi:hypothetical protein [Ureaplasma diversum]|uniref:hypothetical protein n=1 Tax=Ureaplasma diversum TaxID=42094 RepID=UPI00068D0D53|nr:hypothetical protein [Ureaplasma diversum]